MNRFKIILTISLTAMVAGMLAYAYPFYYDKFGISVGDFAFLMAFCIGPMYAVGIIDIWRNK